MNTSITSRNGATQMTVSVVIDLDELADAILRAQERREAERKRAAEEAVFGKLSHHFFGQIDELVAERLPDELRRRWWNRKNLRLDAKPGDYLRPHLRACRLLGSGQHNTEMFTTEPFQTVLDVARTITDDEIDRLKQPRLRSY